MHRQFAINLRDGRVVLCTRETLTNIDYYAISEKVAAAIENGLIDRALVIAKVKGNLLTNQEEWDALLEQKTTQNVRHTTIKAEDAEKSETRIEESDVKSEFDMEIPGGGEEQPKPKAKSGKGGKKAVTPPAEDAGEADNGEGGEAPAAGNVNM